MNRRKFLSTAAATGATSCVAGADDKKKKPQFPIGACDWTIGRQGDPDALRVAKDLGLDGIQASFGKPGDPFDLRTKKARDAYKAAEKKHGTKVASLGMALLNHHPYKSAPETEAWVRDSIDAARNLGVKVVLLAFFGKNDLKGDKEGTAEVIRRLKKVAPEAEDKGIVFGLETWLNVDEHLHIIDAVGSPSVQVYYDVGNSLHKGYDIYSEIRKIGKKRICELHAKDYANGKTFGEGNVDFAKARKILDDIGWSGWIQIESHRSSKDLDGFRADAAHLRKVFG